MTYKIYPEQDIEDIAKAIRSRNGSSEKYTVSEMADAINNFDIYSLVGEDNAPYLYRQAPHLSLDYDREHDTIIGGTVAWNQLVENPTGPSATNIYSGMFSTSNVNIVNNHKYLFSCIQPAGCAVYRQNRTNMTVEYKNYAAPTSASQIAFIGVATGTSTESFGGLVSKNATTETAYQLTKCMLIDLTQMFGSTIADYIYSLEQANEGAGVAWFKKLFPNDYYEYNAGELKSVEELVSHDMVGFNQWDEEWENGFYSRDTGAKAGNSNTTYIRSKNYIPCLPSTTYYFKSPLAHANNSTYYAVLFYDADKNFINSHSNLASYPTKTTPNNARFMTFYVEIGTSGATYQNDICINISNPNRNGEYESYVKYSYPLDNSLTLRGILKLDSVNNLYYDGDIYKSDGSVIRKYGIVDLGTLDWTYSNSRFLTPLSVIGVLRSANFICQKYVGTGITAGGDKTCYMGTSNFAVFDSDYTDATSFKSAMSGVYLVYELAEPTTEQVEPFSAIQICDPNGTEEYVTTSIPVGHETKYLEVVEI